MKIEVPEDVRQTIQRLIDNAKKEEPTDSMEEVAKTAFVEVCREAMSGDVKCLSILNSWVNRKPSGGD